MRGVWVWPLVGVSYHHDRDDHILFLHDEMVWDEVLEGLLRKR